MRNLHYQFHPFSSGQLIADTVERCKFLCSLRKNPAFPAIVMCLITGSLDCFRFASKFNQEYEQVIKIDDIRTARIIGELSAAFFMVRALLLL